MRMPFCLMREVGWENCSTWLRSWGWRSSAFGFRTIAVICRSRGLEATYPSIPTHATPSAARNSRFNEQESWRILFQWPREFVLNLGLLIYLQYTLELLIQPLYPPFSSKISNHLYIESNFFCIWKYIQVPNGRDSCLAL
jgi:hypothetical protein